MAIVYLYLREEDWEKEKISALFEAGFETLGNSDGIVLLEKESGEIGCLGIEDALEAMKVPYDEGDETGYDLAGNGHRHVRFDEAGNRLVREYREPDVSHGFFKILDVFHDHGSDAALSQLRELARKWPKIDELKDRGRVQPQVSSIPPPAEPLTAAYVAIGAMNAYGNIAYANEPDEIRQKLADQHGGQLGIVMAAIMHAGILDTMMELRGNAVDGVFAFDIAEPFGELLMQRMIEQGFVTLAEQRSIADMLFKRLES